jgi:acetylornithine/succinyldiaminopimelate/putrescine aminotransferase
VQLLRVGPFMWVLMVRYDKLLPMNTGAEAWETGVKLARRWAYDVKKVPQDKAVVCCVLSAVNLSRSLLLATTSMVAP